jgi:hypothetical protein
MRFFTITDLEAQVETLKGYTKLLQVSGQVIVVVVGPRLIKLYSATTLMLWQQKIS